MTRRRPVVILHVTESRRVPGEMSFRLVADDPTATPVFKALRDAGFKIGDRVAVVLAESLEVGRG